MRKKSKRIACEKNNLKEEISKMVSVENNLERNSELDNQIRELASKNFLEKIDFQKEIRHLNNVNETLQAKIKYFLII